MEKRSLEERIYAVLFDSEFGPLPLMFGTVFGAIVIVFGVALLFKAFGQ